MDQKLKELHQQAIQAINEGEYARCEALCAQVLHIDERMADSWFLRAMCFSGMQQVQKALANLLKALRLSPRNPEYLAQYAKLCLLVNDQVRASEAAKRVLLHAPSDALTLDTVGVVFTKLSDYSNAYNALKGAVAAKPDHPQFNFNLASAAHFLGKSAEAEHYYQAAISIKPNFARAHWALSELHKNNSNKTQQPKVLERLLNSPDTTAEDELYLCHTLARIKEDAGDYAGSFNLLKRGKSRFGQQLDYTWKHDEALFNSIKESFPLPQSHNEQASCKKPLLGEEAIFVLGMPRSGTTLVERILSTHSEVESLGELQNFAMTVKQLSNSKTANVLDIDVSAKARDLNRSELGQGYLNSLLSRSGEKPRFIDKTPLNFLQLGFICESLPAAKIVLVRRNPMDTCLSNFRQLFAVSFSYYNYQYSIKDTAHYYRLFDDLMSFWTHLYQDRIYVLDYERLIENPEVESQSLISFCGLDWEENCLKFYENKTVVATASAMQVREPMYKSSLARWRKYESDLAEAKAIFDAAGIEY